jgi:MFS family permease
MSPSDRPTLVEPSARAPNPHARRILLVLATAALLVNFIETMLVPALPRLSTFFDNAPYTTVAWILSAYLVVGVCTTPIFAKLGDIYGKRRVLGIVLTLYTVAVALAPLTPMIGASMGLSRASSIYLLIGVRALQGVGLAMFPLALAMVAESLPRAEVAPAQGLIASMFAVGAAFGLVGGAWLIQTSGWQVAYAAVVPVAILLTVLAEVWLPETHRGTAAGMDLPGAAFLGGALATFLLGLTLGSSWGWTAWTGGAIGAVPFGAPEFFALAVLFVVLFLLRERSAAEPIIDLARFGDRNIGLAYLGALLVGCALFVAFVVLTVLVEFPVVGLGRSVLAFGIASIPTTVAMFVAAPLVGRGVARFGPRPMVLLGAGLSMAGFLLLLADHSNYDAIIVEAVPTFVGLIAVLVSVTNVIALAARSGETGIHMGMTEMFQDLGASAGPVVVSTLLATFTTQALVATPASPTGSALVTVPSAEAFQAIFLVGIAIAALLGVVGLLLGNYRVREESVDGSSAELEDEAGREGARSNPVGPA